MSRWLDRFCRLGMMRFDSIFDEDEDVIAYKVEDAHDMLNGFARNR